VIPASRVIKNPQTVTPVTERIDEAGEQRSGRCRSLGRQPKIAGISSIGAPRLSAVFPWARQPGRHQDQRSSGHVANCTRPAPPSSRLPVQTRRRWRCQTRMRWCRQSRRWWRRHPGRFVGLRRLRYDPCLAHEVHTLSRKGGGHPCFKTAQGIDTNKADTCPDDKSGC